MKRLFNKVRIVMQIIHCAADPLSAMKLLYHALVWYAGAYTVSLRAFGRSGIVHLTGDIGDIYTINDVFVTGSYETNLERVRTIIDLGANIGISVLWFRLKYPEAQIRAYEPGAAAFATLQKNFAHDAKIELHQAAVSASGGEISFFESDRSTQSSFFRSDEAVERLVASVTLDEIVGDESVDILKIDIEGAEFDVLQSTRALPHVRLILGELHPVKTGRSIDEAVATLQKTHRVSTTDVPGGRVVLFSASRNGDVLDSPQL